jgi:polar amino acid transport system substrate-binding protein
MLTRTRFISTVVLSAAIVGAVTLAGCASNASPAAGGSQPPSGSPAASATGQKDAALAALVPASIASTGKLIVGTDPTYAPNEYKDSTGKIVGFDIDLFDAVAAKLGLTPQYVGATFDTIVPSVKAGKYNIGVSSFTDNKQREAVVDFVTYYNAGQQWVSPSGKPVDPDNACGLKVSVQTGTTEADDLALRATACTKAGKPTIGIQKFDAQSDATNAVVLGKVAAMSADYPVSVDAVKQTGGKLVLVGKTNFDAAPYGYAIGKNSGQLKEAIQGAVQALITDGTYGRICVKWNLSGGEITQAKINGATS